MAALTTSGTYTYTQSAQQIMNRAGRLLGAFASGEAMPGDVVGDMLSVINALVKGWQATGIHVWCENEAILFLQPGQIQYQLGNGAPDNACLYQDFNQTSVYTTVAAGANSVAVAGITGLVAGAYFCVQLDAGTNFWTTVGSGAITPLAGGGYSVPITGTMPSSATSGNLVFSYVTPLMRPLRVPFGRSYIYSSTITTQMLTLARFDYDILPNQNNTGVVTQYFFDPQTGRGAYANEVALMNVWPAPSDNTRAMRFVAQRPIQDVSSIAALLDFPAEWLQAIAWNLALEMAPEFDVPADRQAVIKDGAQRWFQSASQWDREPESVLFGFATQPGYRVG